MKAGKQEGQAAVFLILAIIMVLLIILILWPAGGSSQNSQPDDPAALFVSSCLRQAGIDAIRHVAGTGGAWQEQNVITQVPGQEEIEEAISRQTERLLDRCYEGFVALSRMGITAQADEPRATAIITQNQVDITLKQTITIEQQGQKKRNDRFAVEIEASLKETIEAARILQDGGSEGSDITYLIRRNINATFLQTGSAPYAVIEFPISGRAEPGRWWVRLN